MTRVIIPNNTYGQLRLSPFGTQFQKSEGFREATVEKMLVLIGRRARHLSSRALEIFLVFCNTGDDSRKDWRATLKKDRCLSLNLASTWLDELAWSRSRSRRRTGQSYLWCRSRKISFSHCSMQSSNLHKGEQEQATTRNFKRSMDRMLACLSLEGAQWRVYVRSTVRFSSEGRNRCLCRG